jgi:hypothetical protein
MRYTDITWEYSDNSELNKQQAASSLGKLVGSRSKNPSSIIHHPSPCSSYQRFAYPQTPAARLCERAKLRQSAATLHPEDRFLRVLEKSWSTGLAGDGGWGMGSSK